MPFPSTSSETRFTSSAKVSKSHLFSLTNAYNNIDSSALVDYGNLVVLMSQFENESTELDDLKKSFTQALSLFENDN